MTRFGNPLAPSQVPNPHVPNAHGSNGQAPNPYVPNTHVPNTQGRAAGGQPSYAQAPQYGYDQAQAQPQDGYDPMAWAGAQGAPRTGQPAAPAQNYADHGYAAEPPSQHRDAYAALRPDGYGYSQPAPQASTQDPFGLAGYTAPQTTQAPAFGQRAAQPAPTPAPGYDGYAGDPFGGSFGATGGQTAGYGQPAHNGAPSFGASHGYGAQSQASHVPSHVNDGFGSGLSAAGYGPNAGAPAADQWNGHGYALDGQGHAGYGDAPHDPHQGHWGGASGYDAAGHIEPSFGGAPAYGQHDPYQQQNQVSFDQSYAEDDAQYQDAPPPRRSFKKIAAVLTCTVLVGVGVTMAYSALLGPGSDEPTPVVKGLASPAKVKPSDPGGKQFDHTDSKIMGRLGEGGAPAADPAGVKKVPIVTVGRDGSIQPPASEETRAVVAVPGLTVIDGLGAPSGLNPTRPAAPAAAAQPAPVEMVKAVEKKKAEAAKAPVVAPTKAAASESVPAIPAKSTTVLNTPKAEPKVEPKKQRVAAATDDAAPVGPKPTGAGYVAVLASVPVSGSSRMDALKQFADMQQKYGMILQNKTPDIQEANLGAKGTYHRLLVGPPGSRDSATSVCTQLKAEGYSGCWVTAY